MAKLSIEIETDNAAFEADPDELARILRELADHVTNGPEDEGGKLYDVNGNYVGDWTRELPEWSGHPDPDDPDHFWIDDDTGERRPAP